MSSLFLYMVSGDLLYVGMALLLFVVVLSPYLMPSHRGWRNGLAWLALVLMALASPPFPWTMDAVFGTAFLLWLIAPSKTTPVRRLEVFRIASATALILLGLILTAMEFLHRSMPLVTGTPDDHLVVIGDSISSG